MLQANGAAAWRETLNLPLVMSLQDRFKTSHLLVRTVSTDTAFFLADDRALACLRSLLLLVAAFYRT